MKTMVVTGGAGFIGSNFVRRIVERYPDYRVIVFDLLTYAGNLDNLAGVLDDDRVSFVRGDIRDAAAVREVVCGANMVVNFAAESFVDRAILAPDVFITTDVLGTYVLLQASREFGVERFLQVSTDEVYGSIEEGSFTEQSDLDPSSPYSASKAGADLLVLASHRTFGTPVLITRSSNNYGSFQYPEKIVPLFISNALDDQPLPVYGDGRNVRDWLHVEDNCAAIDLVLREGEPGNVYNVGGGNEVENLDLTRRILELLGKDAGLVRYVTDRPGHDRRYSVDCSKLRALGWAPRTSFEGGLAATVAWYRDNRVWWEPLKSGEWRAYYERQYEGLA